jgi:hypothetical protein
MPPEVIEPCEYCVVGYIPPLDRFEQIAVHPQGPALLKRCRLCGTLWGMDTRMAGRLTREQAVAIYPDAPL